MNGPWLAKAGGWLTGGILLLGLAAAGHARAAESQPAAAVAPSAVGTNHTALLEYSELEFSPLNWGVSLTPTNTPFRREPAKLTGKVWRGFMQMGGQPQAALPLLWLQSSGKLYLDFNRNQDFTDDPGGLFTNAMSGSDTLAMFRGIHWEPQGKPGDRPHFLDLQINHYASQLYAYAMLRSMWQGPVELQGRRWQVALLDMPDSQSPNLPGNSDRWVLRPWEDRNKSFSQFLGNNPNPEVMEVPHRLFLNRQAYAVTYAYRPGITNRLQVSFTETQPALGELQITGQNIQRLNLMGDTTVVLVSPTSTVQIPTGTYHRGQVLLSRTGSVARVTAELTNPMEIRSGKPAVLLVGGPLTNSVRFTRQGNLLVLNYQLRGPGSATYIRVDQDRSQPPEFEVYQGDKKLAAGKFEYG